MQAWKKVQNRALHYNAVRLPERCAPHKPDMPRWEIVLPERFNWQGQKKNATSRGAPPRGLPRLVCGPSL